jgi:hypothetical protein
MQRTMSRDAQENFQNEDWVRRSQSANSLASAAFETKDSLDVLERTPKEDSERDSFQSGSFSFGSEDGEESQHSRSASDQSSQVKSPSPEEVKRTFFPKSHPKAVIQQPEQEDEPQQTITPSPLTPADCHEAVDQQPTEPENDNFYPITQRQDIPTEGDAEPLSLSLSCQPRLDFVPRPEEYPIAPSPSRDGSPEWSKRDGDDGDDTYVDPQTFPTQSKQNQSMNEELSHKVIDSSEGEDDHTGSVFGESEDQGDDGDDHAGNGSAEHRQGLVDDNKSDQGDLSQGDEMINDRHETEDLDKEPEAKEDESHGTSVSESKQNSDQESHVERDSGDEGSTMSLDMNKLREEMKERERMRQLNEERFQHEFKQDDLKSEGGTSVDESNADLEDGEQEHNGLKPLEMTATATAMDLRNSLDSLSSHVKESSDQRTNSKTSHHTIPELLSPYNEHLLHSSRGKNYQSYELWMGHRPPSLSSSIQSSSYSSPPPRDRGQSSSSPSRQKVPIFGRSTSPEDNFLFSFKETVSDKDFILQNKRRVREYQRSRSPPLQKETQSELSASIRRTHSAVRSTNQPKRRTSNSRNSPLVRVEDDRSISSGLRFEPEAKKTDRSSDLHWSKRPLSASRLSKSPSRARKAHHPRAWGSGDGLRTVDKVKETTSTVEEVETIDRQSRSNILTQARRGEAEIRRVKVSTPPATALDKWKEEVFKGKYKVRDEIQILSNRITVLVPTLTSPYLTFHRVWRPIKLRLSLNSMR